MRFLLINTDYGDFLTSLYRQYPGLDARTSKSRFGHVRTVGLAWRTSIRET